MQYNSLHEDFLGRLRNIHQLVRQGRVLLEEVAARWHKADTLLDSNWRALGEAALARAKRELDGRTVQCGVTHGDFVPWNTRVDGGRLFVFDWESASWEAPGGWDEFHFYTQVASLLRNNALHLLLDRWSGQRASFLLYLLSSVCSLLDEDVPAAHAEIMCRQSMLAEQLVS